MIRHAGPLCLVLVVLARSVWGAGEQASVMAEYSSPDFMAVREAYTKGLEAAQLTRTAALARLLQVNLENADVMLKEKTKVRNTTGIAVANQAKSLFAGALSNLNATGRLDLPEKVRRELSGTLDEIKAGSQRIEESFENAKTELLKSHLPRFQSLVVQAHPERQADTTGEGLKREFLEWIAAKQEVASVTSPGTNGVAGEVSSNMIIAARGEAAKWVTIGNWQGAVAGMDVIALSLAQMQCGTNVEEKANPIAGVPSRFEYHGFYSFPVQSPVAVRLKSVPGMEGVEVLEWPSSGNDHTLSLRLSSVKYPSRHAFELQVGVPEAGVASLYPGAVVETVSGKVEAAPPVLLSVATLPTGAAVWLDGVPVKDAKSPCRVPVPVGKHTVELVLPGYQKMTLSDENFITNRTVKWKFLPDPRVISKTCSLSAAVNQWYPSGIIVQQGALIAVRAEGEWSCGSKRERCSAAGYSSSVPTYRHYDDPALRQVPGANYGALLARIGKDGPPMVVGKAGRFKAETKGMLYFDVNEVTGRERRNDNEGELTIRISIIPPEGP